MAVEHDAPLTFLDGQGRASVLMGRTLGDPARAGLTHAFQTVQDKARGVAVDNGAHDGKPMARQALESLKTSAASRRRNARAFMASPPALSVERFGF